MPGSAEVRAVRHGPAKAARTASACNVSAFFMSCPECATVGPKSEEPVVVRNVVWTPSSPAKPRTRDVSTDASFPLNHTVILAGRRVGSAAGSEPTMKPASIKWAKAARASDSKLLARQSTTSV